MIITIGIGEFICMAIPIIGRLISPVPTPFTIIFEARYLCRIYDSAGPA